MVRKDRAEDGWTLVYLVRVPLDTAAVAAPRDSNDDADRSGFIIGIGWLAAGPARESWSNTNQVPDLGRGLAGRGGEMIFP